jgi:hypothetical protein
MWFTSLPSTFPLTPSTKLQGKFGNIPFLLHKAGKRAEFGEYNSIFFPSEGHSHILCHFYVLYAIFYILLRGVRVICLLGCHGRK